MYHLPLKEAHRPYRVSYKLNSLSGVISTATGSNHKRPEMLSMALTM